MLYRVGTRHVKVWRTDESAASRSSKPRQSEAGFLSNATHKTLPGRNCLLETLIDANFTSVVAIGTSKAVVASDKGDICLIDDSDGNQRFIKMTEVGFSVTSMAFDSKRRLHLASAQGGLKTCFVDSAIGSWTPPPSPPPRVELPAMTMTTGSSPIHAMGSLLEHLVTVDTQHFICISHLHSSDDETSVGEVVQRLPAHGDSVRGVNVLAKPNSADASFYTLSSGGSILFWNSEGVSTRSLNITLEQVEGNDIDTNELKTACASADASYIVTGDRYGILRILDCSTGASTFDFKAHSGEITDIAIFEAKEPAYIASCARDRTVQIFTKKGSSWDLMQTLDEHVGAVTGILFSKDGTRLVTSSSDRTLVVRELVSRSDDGETISAFIILRTVILKSSPVSMTWDVEQGDFLLVSTIDRHVHKYDLRNGQCLTSFRVGDNDGGDTVILSSLAHIPRTYGPPLIAGACSTDKSIRLYDESGTLIARDWGHTEGVTDIALVTASDEDDNDQKSLVTVAVDGTIFIWNLEFRVPYRLDVSKSMDLTAPSTPTNQELLANKPPLRRVLSQSELARFQRSPDDDATTPTGSRSPKLRKKVSKFSLAQTPKLEPSPISTVTRDNRPSVSNQAPATSRRTFRNRSPSPPSPRNRQITKRRSSMDIRSRAKASASDYGSLGSSTESLCRTLRAYRRRLANSTDKLSPEIAKELERELTLTTQAAGEKARSGLDESALNRILDSYSERMMTMFDERILASLAVRVRENSESGLSMAMVSPTIDQEEEQEQPEFVDRRDHAQVFTPDMESVLVAESVPDSPRRLNDETSSVTKAE